MSDDAIYTGRPLDPEYLERAGRPIDRPAWEEAAPRNLPAAWRDGWAIVELMGHVTEVGYVTVENYGGAVLFRCESPCLSDPEIVTLPEFGHIPRKGYFEKGTRFKKLDVPARSVLIGAAAIYRLRPCSEADALKELNEGREIELLPEESETA